MSYNIYSPIICAIGTLPIFDSIKVYTCRSSTFLNSTKRYHCWQPCFAACCCKMWRRLRLPGIHPFRSSCYRIPVQRHPCSTASSRKPIGLRMLAPLDRPSLFHSTAAAFECSCSAGDSSGSRHLVHQSQPTERCKRPTSPNFAFVPLRMQFFAPTLAN